MKLLVEGYFTLSFHHTAYSVNVYLQPSATAARFTRLSQDEIEQGSGPAFDCVFLKKPGRKGAASGSGSAKKAAEKAAAAEKAGNPFGNPDGAEVDYEKAAEQLNLPKDFSQFLK